jgi:hypothetical protein
LEMKGNERTQEMATKDVRKARFTLKGITPLLMHADDVEAASTLDEWRKAPGNKNVSVPGDDRSPPWTWQTYLYRNEGGMVAMPADNVMVALRQAGAKMTLKRQTTFKAITQSGLLMTDETLEFTNGGEQINAAAFVDARDDKFAMQKKAVEKAGFELLIKRAKVGTSKHVRVRPMFRSWVVSGVIQVMAPEITFENLQMLFDLAGDVGLCDWRPGCKTPGRFGMFEASVIKA